MRFRKLIRIGAPLAACLVAAAFAGFAPAAAGSHAVAARTKATKQGLRCVRYDLDDQPKCLRDGPRGHYGPRGRTGSRGYRGHRGVTGVTGVTGATGAVGAVGAVGLQGARGPQGAQGIQGIQGIAGRPGAFATGGSDQGGNTIVVIGTKVGPFPDNNGSLGQGLEINPPSVAVCPNTGADQEAFDGGVNITTSGPNDVVAVESAYPGHYVNSTEVDPLPVNSPPGSVSQQPADAYEAQAVVLHMENTDTVTVQAYVVCGP